MEKYFPAHQNGTRFGLVQDTELLWLTYRIIDARIEARRQDAELSLGMFCNIFRHALGDDWAPVEICFEHEAPEGAAAHAECFGAPVRFGSHTNAIAFFRRDLDSTMPEADPYLYSIIESFLKSRTQINENPEDLAAVVREQIKMHLKESAPTLKDIAAVLGLSDHRLRRKLRSHGLSYQELLRAARRELALKYIADPDISLTEVALSLGYSELSAFSRAFHAWTGMYPQRYRRIKAGA